MSEYNQFEDYQDSELKAINLFSESFNDRITAAEKTLNEDSEYLIFEEEVKRSELPDSVFGIPEDRKYPLDSEKHVRSAIRLFGHCPDAKKKALAKRISSKAKEYNIEIPETTQVYKYAHEANIPKELVFTDRYITEDEIYANDLYELSLIEAEEEVKDNVKSVGKPDALSREAVVTALEKAASIPDDKKRSGEIRKIISSTVGKLSAKIKYTFGNLRLYNKEYIYDGYIKEIFPKYIEMLGPKDLYKLKESIMEHAFTTGRGHKSLSDVINSNQNSTDKENYVLNLADRVRRDLSSVLHTIDRLYEKSRFDGVKPYNPKKETPKEEPKVEEEKKKEEEEEDNPIKEKPKKRKSYWDVDVSEEDEEEAENESVESLNETKAHGYSIMKRMEHPNTLDYKDLEKIERFTNELDIYNKRFKRGEMTESEYEDRVKNVINKSGDLAKYLSKYGSKDVEKYLGGRPRVVDTRDQNSEKTKTYDKTMSEKEVNGSPDHIEKIKRHYIKANAEDNPKETLKEKKALEKAANIKDPDNDLFVDTPDDKSAKITMEKSPEEKKIKDSTVLNHKSEYNNIDALNLSVKSKEGILYNGPRAYGTTGKNYDTRANEPHDYTIQGKDIPDGSRLQVDPDSPYKKDQYITNDNPNAKIKVTQKKKK